MALGALVGLAAVVRPVWRISRGWVTLAHELGHALTAIVTEARVRRIRIHRDTSGLTEWAGESAGRRLPRGIVAWWGHPAPGAAAVAVAAGLAAGRVVLVSQLLAAIVALVTIIWVRNAWGVALGATLAGVAAGAAALGPDASLATGAAVATLWAAGGLRAAASASSRARRGDGSDAAVLAEVLWLPVGAWAVTMILVSALAAAATGYFLVVGAQR